ncbi:MAG TPA: thioredoxin family protein [Gammaproteobacteria bacterium]|nr:thioredoxin family protein [Gammaproteobacteria bacterium]
MPLNVELFISPYCRRCEGVRKSLRAVLSGLPADVAHVEERNVLEHLDRAVELGVTATPALALNGTLMAVGGWREAQLRAWLTAAAPPGNHNGLSDR